MNGIRIETKFINSTIHKSIAEDKAKNWEYVFPFELILGVNNLTEAGFNDNISIYDFTTYQRIFNGKENVLARWKGAYKTSKELFDEGGVFTPSEKVEGFKKEYVPGEFWKCQIISDSGDINFVASPVDNQFVAQQDSRAFTIRRYDKPITREDLYQFYIIPKRSQKQWLRISSPENFYNETNKEFAYSEFKLVSIDNEIASSGRAVQEFIQLSGGGEGYAYPEITATNEVIVDDVLKRDIPIQAMQIEVDSAIALNSIFAYGRPVDYGNEGTAIQTKFNERVLPPRLLLPYEVVAPTPSPFTRPEVESNYLIGQLQPTMWESYNDWREQYVNSYTMQDRTNFEGVLKGNLTQLQRMKGTNPLNANGGYSYVMWAPSWTILTYFDKDTTCNDLINTGRITPDTNFQTKFSTNGQQMSIPEWLAHNAIIYKDVMSLPLSIANNVPFALSEIPIVEGFIPKVLQGYPIGWRKESTILNLGQVDLMLPASVHEYGNVMRTNNRDKDIFIPFDTFKTENDKIGIAGINCAFKVKLTDIFTKEINSQTHTFSTLNLGQRNEDVKRDINGKLINWGNVKFLTWDSSCKPIDPMSVGHIFENGIELRPRIGYVIDLPITRFIARANYRLTFFSFYDVQVWSGVYQSNAKFTGNIRDWTNSIKLTNWRLEASPFSFPKDIVAPTPTGIEFPIIEIRPNVKRAITYDWVNKWTTGITFDFELNPYTGDPKIVNVEGWNFSNKLYRAESPGSGRFEFSLKDRDEKFETTSSSNLIYELNYANYGVNLSTILSKYKTLEIEYTYWTNKPITQTIQIDISKLQLGTTYELPSGYSTIAHGKWKLFEGNNGKGEIDGDLVNPRGQIFFKISSTTSTMKIETITKDRMNWYDSNISLEKTGLIYFPKTTTRTFKWLPNPNVDTYYEVQIAKIILK